MCLIAVAWRAHRHYPLVVIANRDEFHARPAAAAGFDPEAGEVYGGRDLLQGGSWLSASTRARLAAVTNVRAGRSREALPRSRGWLVRDFVRGDLRAIDNASALGRTGRRVRRFQSPAVGWIPTRVCHQLPGADSFGRVIRIARDVERRL
jgi:hypothetical protein